MVFLIFYLVMQTAVAASLLDMRFASGWNAWFMVFIALVFLGSVALLTYITVMLIKKSDEELKDYHSRRRDSNYKADNYEPREKVDTCSLFLGLLGDSSHGTDTGHCNGDCANCPPHYGYRYDRWYYGHGHQHGCQRGGNGGAFGQCYRD